LQITTYNVLTRTMVRLCLGVAVFGVATSVARAQTYYYYPSTTASSPTYTMAPGTGPAYYTPSYRQNPRAWRGYTPQYYQVNYNTPSYGTTYTPQYYQTAYSQPTVPVTYATQTTQATTPGTQVVQTSYVTPTTSQPAATTEPAASTPATTTPDTTAATTGATATAAATTAAPAPAPAPAVAASDPYGFLSWLNSTRAAYGLPAVGYDPNLESWAAMNSAEQASRGIGHFVMGPARRQNSAMGGFPGVESMWMGSPAHRAALLDPTIQWIGIAAYGAYWTFNAY
jgi:uncharacterized protein YkwD